MNIYNISLKLSNLSRLLEGELLYDNVSCLLYSTDASSYREKPLAVALPRNKDDIRKIIIWSAENKIPITPRTAGTSLAGQVVAGGVIVDVSRYMNRIIELNRSEKWVIIEPGVILDELNQYLKPYGLFFGPETSTSNRCMIGGMVGNNACGAHSILYGSTRDHTLELDTILSDGSEVRFKDLTVKEFEEKCKGNNLESKIYRSTRDILESEINKESILKDYPDPDIPRRNTGYALDLLLKSDIFTEGEKPFNFSKLLAGSEGTLAFTTSIKLNLVDLPPRETGLVCIHFKTLKKAFKANLTALKYKPGAVEMMDSTILELTKGNIEQQKNRFFVKGNPAAILIIEFARDTRREIEVIAKDLEAEMKKNGFGYHFPVVFQPDVDKVWNLRKAGLGVLSNMKGDAKTVSLIEDTAVNVNVFSEYMDDFKAILAKHNKECVYYAHIGSGELHLRPVLNLKDEEDVKLFRTLGLEVARLVKKYKGSMSGEHGDGRLRGEFIPVILGEKNYRLLEKVKNIWDPYNIFNPGKIVNTPRMNTNLRYIPGKITPDPDTIFDFSDVGGIVRAAEKCNGSGDCRKTEKAGGTMCPSYMATHNEYASTRARANLLRELLNYSGNNVNIFDHNELYEILDLCLSCKGCKSECPSSVDITKIKAEFLHHYYDSHGIPLRTWFIANISKINHLGSFIPALFNLFAKNTVLSYPVKKLLKFSQRRSIPGLSPYTFKRWVHRNLNNINPENPKNGTVHLFIDEFTNYNDASLGIKSVKLLIKLGYRIEVQSHKVSGRTYLSKGLLRKAQKIAEKNIEIFKSRISGESPLLGIEPSAILSFRDEYPDLVRGEIKQSAIKIAKNTFMVDEFLIREMQKGKIKSTQFTHNKQHIMLHGHCQQKSIASTDSTKKLLSLPANYTVEEIPSGCCGMAGSFGFEKEHYDLSMKVGELVLFPAIRETRGKSVIAAPGTSCRHQIKDGTNRTAYHPVELLYDALNDEQV